MGVQEILERDPQHRPAKLARSPAPFVHAATEMARKEFYGMYSWFVAAFQAAAERLRLGDRTACFPAGSSSNSPLRLGLAARDLLFESNAARAEGDRSKLGLVFGRGVFETDPRGRHRSRNRDAAAAEAEGRGQDGRDLL